MYMCFLIFHSNKKILILYLIFFEVCCETHDIGLKIIFFSPVGHDVIMDVFHAGCTSFMLDIFTLPLAKL